MTDEVIQRIIEVLFALPAIPLWMALAAALPQDWPQLRLYFYTTIILSILGWTSLARVVRGRLLSMREEDFVMAARLSGSSELRVIVRHMAPSFASHIIASITLSIPGMILSETSLSFLGLGVQPPASDWGSMVRENLQGLTYGSYAAIWPAVAIASFTIAINLIVDDISAKSGGSLAKKMV